MSMKLSGSRRRAGAVIGAGVGLVLVISVWLLLGDHVPTDMRQGFLAGGLVAIGALGIALWRSVRHPGAASTAERAMTGGGDERDIAVLTRSLAISGVLAIPMTGAAAIALAAGARTDATMAILLWAQLVMVAVAFALINRRT